LNHGKESAVKRGVVVVVVSLVAALSGVFGAKLGLAADGELFKFKGKAYKTSDLSPALQQAMFDVEKEHYDRMNQIADNAILDIYLNEEAAKQKKTREQIEAELFAVPTPSDADVKTWYEANKARVPYPLEKIQDEVKKLLTEQKAQEKKMALLTSVKQAGKSSLSVKEPVSPIAKIATDGRPAKGNPNAKVVLVEFADYQCPHCKAAEPGVRSVMTKYQDKAKLVFMDFPINPSGISKTVAEGSFCALEQNKYWEYHVMAYDKQDTLTNDSPMALAKELKLDEAAFKTCLGSERPKKFVEEAKNEGKRLGIGGTPTFFLNGKKLNGGHGEEQLTEAIEKALKQGAS
jgi:protein-disulfide isomerase